MRVWSTFVFATLLGGCAAPEGVEQSASCGEFVRCIEARDEVRGVRTDLDRYVEGGDCWGNPEIAELCTTSCERGLEYLRGRFFDLPEVCTP